MGQWAYVYFCAHESEGPCGTLAKHVSVCDIAYLTLVKVS